MFGIYLVILAQIITDILYRYWSDFCDCYIIRTMDWFVNKVTNSTLLTLLL